MRRASQILQLLGKCRTQFPPRDCLAELGAISGWLPQQQQWYRTLEPITSTDSSSSSNNGHVQPSHSFTSSHAAQAFALPSFGPVDPFQLVKEEIDSVSERLRRSIFTGIPTLRSAAQYFFKVGAEGKRFRPTMLLLMASSLSSVMPSPDYLTVDDRPPNVHPEEERRRQQRIAEITEMIHVASLLHDDVIDNAEMRRGLKALNSVFGNKIAILAGDFLLARASVSLAALRDSEVIQLLSQVIEDLVTGEILQMTSTEEDLLSLDHYVRKTFHKTASLMANSCKAIAILGGQNREVAQSAWEYGRHVGLAFQFVDDVLDFTGSTMQLGKPALNDLKSGLATAPVLYAAEEHPELHALILRRFKCEGDVERATELVFNSRGIQRARDLAAQHAELAVQAVQSLPACSNEHALMCRQALTEITARVLARKK
ncbi:g18 [Coccomyxa viridis]|uniref:G18 protein n=1 Tax=Coccomyxa viridis TaxID=1274662 RepID=A0ABP1FEZ4_9CHLO